jgi:tRNA (cmo5U34)-methyltransferase
MIDDGFQIPTDWTFKTADVAAGFDDHVREQLPWYDIATASVAHVIRHYLPDGGLMYDIGASTGNIGRSVADTLKNRQATLIPIESSTPMAALYSGPGRVVIADATQVDYQPFDVCVLFLVTMFMPVSSRSRLLEKLAEKVRPGGCIIIFDKFDDDSLSGYARTMLHRLTLAGKVANGVPFRQIIQKELSLAGSQRPLDIHYFRAAFPSAFEIFKFGEFSGWVIEAERITP